MITRVELALAVLRLGERGSKVNVTMTLIFPKIVQKCLLNIVWTVGLENNPYTVVRKNQGGLGAL